MTSSSDLTSSTSSSAGSKLKGPRSMARLWAVKALFQYDQVHTPAALLVTDIKRFWIHDAFEGVTYLPLDDVLFENIVHSAVHHCIDIDQKLIPLLPQSWPWERLDPVVRSILRAGCGEARLDAPPPHGVLINEYVDVAAAFLGNAGTGLINKILDQALKAS